MRLEPPASAWKAGTSEFAAVPPEITTTEGRADIQFDSFILSHWHIAFIRCIVEDDARQRAHCDDHRSAVRLASKPFHVHWQYVGISTYPLRIQDVQIHMQKCFEAA